MNPLSSRCRPSGRRGLLLAALVMALVGCTRERPPATTLPLATTAVGSTPVATVVASPAAVNPAAMPTVGPMPTRGDLGPLTGLPPTPITATEATPAQPTSVPTGTFVYTVQAGDTLSAIARRFGVGVNELAQLNRLSNPGLLRVGQELVIPGQAPAATPTVEGYVHVVRAGETLYGISRQYGVPLDQLAAINQITNPATIRVGQRLIIPTYRQQTPAAGAQRVHIVQPGETLSSIAARYGVSPKAIAEINKLENPSRIFSGQRLIIP
ncbi:MAG: LysM peptidoglycan-binding domain-containing protein [Anaerolineae bacterium]|nr:LysM peptidoglycan-binding domain-containing protein [Caldilineales bacterium]MCX7852491.1 LysM peptidoglycan-binding domain-containing protein [Caldilineales bacterium]MDW8268619.1 LysM peptidoglycan-binding domain-containing protein [Anaerolineae bacterium]